MEIYQEILNNANEFRKGKPMKIILACKGKKMQQKAVRTHVQQPGGILATVEVALTFV